MEPLLRPASALSKGTGPGFLTRAIHTGKTVGDDDFCGADAYLALAELAVDSGNHDLAFVAIARARDLGDSRDEVNSSTT